ncbi:MAG: fumarylacetoacetate hydrolase family protein [Paracoccaceae bacterium]|nr:fumarylacetoacetate hydrolase family protein [Paracoccaceae bacterium]
MTDFIFPPAATPSLPIGGEDRAFPVRRVYCVGRNYAAHAVEMGHDPDREAPFFFQKNPNNLAPGADLFPYPPMSEDVHHEIELMVALKSGGRDIPEDRAGECVFGYGVALDMTRRDLQGEMKIAGRPWEIGKAFEESAPCSELVPVSETGWRDNGAIWLDVNGERRQTGDLNQMIWKVPEMIAYLSQYFELSAGDVILTGTPSGVGPVSRGDLMEGGVEGLGQISVRVV